LVDVGKSRSLVSLGMTALAGLDWVSFTESNESTPRAELSRHMKRSGFIRVIGVSSPAAAVLINSHAPNFI